MIRRLGRLGPVVLSAILVYKWLILVMAVVGALIAVAPRYHYCPIGQLSICK